MSTSDTYYFTLADYAVFLGMLLVSSGIGLYFAFKVSLCLFSVND